MIEVAQFLPTREQNTNLRIVHYLSSVFSCTFSQGEDSGTYYFHVFETIQASARDYYL